MKSLTQQDNDHNLFFKTFPNSKKGLHVCVRVRARVCKIKINIQCDIADTFYTPNEIISILSGVCVNTSEDEIIKKSEILINITSW